jgi:hypothetical protein
MWAQLITARLKPGKEDGMQTMLAQLRESEQPGSGLVRSTTFQHQDDPPLLSIMVVFDSEDAARARESDERRQESLNAARATMADIFDGPPEFKDLVVVDEFVP